MFKQIMQKKIKIYIVEGIGRSANVPNLKQVHISAYTYLFQVLCAMNYHLK